ncbi:hypothetical protein KUV75_06780 [Qipengyuania gaetbuli]|uniref:hypothetical protein n=1 Tax=Qipengyuania gaetbuli TaxID=266952 RepID=UPI001C9A130D|nr:hypothetical protein [Qipengyuania gaetbuli]MBY6014606.1 hypothetical protein [Qipengyuania gaetbuli]
MKRAFPTLVVSAAAIALVGGSALAQSAQPIASDEQGALEAPEYWDCDRIRPEYTAYLDAGNAPESWRYFGKTYRDVANDRIYTWQDWLDWADDAGCGAARLAEPKPNTAIGILLGFFGAGLIAAVGGGGGSISPG